MAPPSSNVIRRFAPELNAVKEFFPLLARVLNSHSEKLKTTEKMPDLPQLYEMLWRMQEMLALAQEQQASLNLSSVTEIALAPAAAGNFQLPHRIGTRPQVVVIEMTSAGVIWFQNPPYDSAYLYLVASDGPLTAKAKVFT